MRIYVFDCGVMGIPYINIYDDDVARNNPGMLMWAQVGAFLIEHGEEMVLFDTGCDPDGLSGNWPDLYRQIPFSGSHLPQRLEELGVKPEDIKDIVVSHLHFDHAGCLHLFPHARVFVSGEELDSTMHAYENNLDMNAHLGSDVRNWAQAGVRWEKVYADKVKLADGLTIVNLGSGHAWGMLGLLAESPGGNYFFVSDAIYSRKNLGPPQVVPSLVHDREGYQKTVEFIQEYASRNNAEIIFGHDAEQFKELLEKSPF